MKNIPKTYLQRGNEEGLIQQRTRVSRQTRIGIYIGLITYGPKQFLFEVESDCWLGQNGPTFYFSLDFRHQSRLQFGPCNSRKLWKWFIFLQKSAMIVTDVQRCTRFETSKSVFSKLKNVHAFGLKEKPDKLYARSFSYIFIMVCILLWK